jgi:filamentous hemagglutinin family protein
MQQLASRLWVASSIVLSCLATLTPARAQIVPDNTLPVNSSVTPGCTVCRIDGGTLRGTNLFHSFSEFSVPRGGEAFFNNGLQIQNILTRVTGSSVSNIDGRLRANGTANLFLLNPNGIIFGQNATLNLGGSFIASTASSLVFADGTVFSAKPHTSTPPLLTISVPLGLQFGGNPGKILVQGNGQGIKFTFDLFTSDLPDLIDTNFGLRVPSNQTLAIVGGDMSLEGATLKTAGGRIELGSVAGSGFVSLTPIAKGWALGYQGVSAFGDIQLSQQAAVDASGLGGGDIAIWGRHMSLTSGSQIETSTLGTQPGGTLAVNATDVVELIGTSTDGRFPSLLAASVYRGAKGAGGELSIDTGRLIVRDGAAVITGTLGEGPSGNLRVNATESVEVIGTSALLTASVFPGAKGAGGELSIDTGRLIVRDGAVVATGTLGEGSSGNLRVNATQSVELVGTSSDGKASSALTTSVFPGAKGAGGELSIDTGRLIVRDGAVVATATFGEGQAGNLRVNATQSVELVGRSSDGRAANGLFTSVQPGAKGAGGELSIDTGRLIVRDGATVTTSTLGEGPSGNLRVNATESVEVTGRSPDGFPSLLTGRTRTAFNGGTLRVETGRLVVGDGAQITVSSTSSGQAGTLELKADSILLDNQASLQANTTGGGGNISLTTPLLLLRRGSNITTNAQGNNIQGGNITIDTDNLVAIPQEDSDISANSQDSRGGNVTINAQGIFGIQFRPLPTPLSDITASGKDFFLNGIVDINTLGVNPTQGLVALPTTPVDPSRQISQECSAQNRESRFTVTGRGGLPQSPTEIISPDMVQDDLGTQVASNPPIRESIKPSPSREPKQLVEAQGWVVDDKGVVTLYGRFQVNRVESIQCINRENTRMY